MRMTPFEARLFRGRWERLRAAGAWTYVVLVFGWFSLGPRAIVMM